MFYYLIGNILCTSIMKTVCLKIKIIILNLNFVFCRTKTETEILVESLTAKEGIVHFLSLFRRYLHFEIFNEIIDIIQAWTMDMYLFCCILLFPSVIFNFRTVGFDPFLQ